MLWSGGCEGMVLKVLFVRGTGPGRGPLTGGGGGMSPVNFKKSLCRMSLSLIIAHVAC